VSDQASYNNFLNQLFTFTLSDSLILPDSIRANRVERTASNYAAGASWRLPNRRGIFGVEYHWMTDLSESDLGGTAAERVAWDVRSGLEYVFTHVLVGRAGYIYRFDDRDEATEQNEFVSHAVTAGFGLRHPGSSWGLEAGYAFEWGQADFGTPAQPRSTRQQLAAGLHWSF
jgi:hypothetical protein